MLDRATYLPMVIAAWNGMMNVSPAQAWLAAFKRPEVAPAAAATTETHDYGVGSFSSLPARLYNMVK